MNRRSFMASILATACAPAVVGSGILMPVKKLVVSGFWTPLVHGVLDTYEWGWISDSRSTGVYTRIGNVVSYNIKIHVGAHPQLISRTVAADEFRKLFPRLIS